ncbi:hypothetical protein IV203_001187 [Nitzschia inconspicua]|uniref:Uncharacterized protein n=1 Tax=Nitzschia inconspicua TaxID=303405 RepID=A0A9K3PRB6_9STRA|nr:hypothetical protein IV203_001187 [Nitzschia inconspicua]
MKISDTVMGGQPVTFDDIKTHRDILKKFTYVLFEDDTDRRWNPRALEKACDNDDYDDDLHFKDDLMFVKWCGEARQAFLSRNAPGLPVETFRLYGDDPDGRGILMDTRTLIDHFNALASVAQANHMELQRQRRVLNDIRNAFNVESKITSSFIIEKLFKMERSIRRLEENLIGEAPASAPPPSKGVIRFSISSKGLPKNASLSEVTTAFFADDYMTGYLLDTKSPSWNELDAQEKKSLRSKFSCIKRAVRIVLQHADSFPLKSNNPVQYKDLIRGIATKAEEKIRENLGFDSKTITIYKVEKQLTLPRMKGLEKSLNLPDNTPDDMRKFFNSN